MEELDSILRASRQLIEEYDEGQRELELKKKELESKKKQRDEIAPHLELLEKVRVFLQTLAEATRDEIMAGLQEVVTLCLQSAFGPYLTFEIEVETKRNNTGVEFYVVDSSIDKDNPIRLKPVGNDSGGVIDTVSLGLRFGLLKVINPQPLGPLILDEPAKMVSNDRIASIAGLIKELSDMFDKQIIMVTHHTDTELMDIVDHAVFVKKEQGVSTLPDV